MSAAGSIVVSRPATPAELVLLFHGVGATAADLLPLAQLIAKSQPQAMVVSVEAPFPTGGGAARQWFSVQGVTETNRAQRVAQALPVFTQTVAQWQADAGIAAQGTTLVGFSQGAIMSLESTQAEPLPAQRVVSLAGRFAAPVRRATPRTVFHLVHGDQDGVVPHGHSVQAAKELGQFGATVTLDVLPGLGHGIDGRVARLVLAYLAAGKT